MQTLTVNEIAKELAGIRSLILVDRVYGVVHSAYLRDTFIPWFKDWCIASGLSYESEGRDCDKFARAFAGQAHFAAWRRRSRPACAVGWMAVTDQGGHALNLARTEQGWIEIEPQTGVVQPFRTDRRSIIYAVL